LPHPLVVGKDKTYRKFMAKTVLGERSTLKVDFDDDIDDFFILVNIF
jgi:hypothetical protein